MRIYLCTILITGLFTSSVIAEGFFEKLKRRGTEAVNEKIDEQIDATKKERPPATNKRESSQKARDTEASNTVITSAEDIYGRWHGMVKPSGRGYSMSTIGVDIVVKEAFGSMRVSMAATRGLAELQPTDTPGEYEATFIDQSKSCGTRALLTFHNEGFVKINWIDMPNLNTENRLYQGRLKRLKPYERKWSASEDQRKAFDVVGFMLGMTYEEALRHHESKHQDLGHEINFIKDRGTAAIVSKLTEKNAKRYGPDVLGEQLTLIFESQTNEEMQVDQDPKVLAKIEQRQKILDQRAEMMAQQNRSRRRDRSSQTQLPDVPEMPKLRPSGAEARLMVISRKVLFANNTAPHQDKIIEAMSNKYGKPSLHIKDLSSMGGRYSLAWIFDASNNRIDDAQGGPCDHQSPGASTSGLVNAYSVGTRAARARSLHNPVTVSPRCGLIVKTELRVSGEGSVLEMTTTVYDQQRLLGDEWHRTVKFNQALIAASKAEAETVSKRDIPDL